MIRSSRRVDVHQMGVFYIKYALVENIKQHREPSDGHEVASQVHGGRDFRMTKASRPSGTAGKSVWASGKTSGGDAPRNGRNICVIVIPNPVEQAMFLCILGSRGRQAAPSGRGTRGAGGGGGRECRRGSSRPAGSPEAPGKARQVSSPEPRGARPCPAPWSRPARSETSLRGARVPGSGRLVQKQQESAAGVQDGAGEAARGLRRRLPRAPEPKPAFLVPLP